MPLARWQMSLASSIVALDRGWGFSCSVVGTSSSLVACVWTSRGAALSIGALCCVHSRDMGKGLVVWGKQRHRQQECMENRWKTKPASSGDCDCDQEVIIPQRKHVQGAEGPRPSGSPRPSALPRAKLLLFVHFRQIRDVILIPGRDGLAGTLTNSYHPELCEPTRNRPMLVQPPNAGPPRTCSGIFLIAHVARLPPNDLEVCRMCRQIRDSKAEDCSAHGNRRLAPRPLASWPPCRQLHGRLTRTDSATPRSRRPSC